MRMMGGTKKEDEANERRAREKLLARRNSARSSAAASATQNAPKTSEDDRNSSKSLVTSEGSTTTVDDSKIKGNAKGHKEGKDNNIHSTPVPSKTRKEDRGKSFGSDTSAPQTSHNRNGSKQRSDRRKSAKARERERKREKGMRNRDGSEPPVTTARSDARERNRGPPSRGGNDRYSPPPAYYRDEFGRGPPPGHWDDYRLPAGGQGFYNDHHGPPPMRHRERGGGQPPRIPPRRWERDRGMNALPPHPRSLRRGRSRSPPSRDRLYRNDHVHPDYRHYQTRNRRPRDIRQRSRRGQSHDSGSSRSFSSRSRSFSSRGSSSSFSSSEDGSRRNGRSNYDSDDSRSRSTSRSRSRSFSRSRSPLPRSPEGKNEAGKSGLSVEQKKAKENGKKKDEENTINTMENDVKKVKEPKSPSSSKGSRSSQKRDEKLSRSRSRSLDSCGRRRLDRKRKNSRSFESRYSQSTSRSRSPASSLSRSRSPVSSSHSSSSSRQSRHRRRDRRSKRRRKKKLHESSQRVEKQPEFTKDQRTIFVSQLVMRTTERDLKKYFKKKVGCKVNDVILLRDRRNARNHKGCAYVEVGHIEDVAKAVNVSGQPPDFQRFPILIKASEAEKNYANPLSVGTPAIDTKTEALVGSTSSAIAVTPTNNGYASTTYADQEKQKIANLPPLKDENGRLIESQKVYVGGLDPSVGEDHLYALFSQFGGLQNVQLQYQPNTRISRGYAFLAFRDPKVSHLAIRTMAGKIVAGRSLKTGWANQNQQSSASIASGCTVVTSDEFPVNAAELTQKALKALAQMTGAINVAINLRAPIPVNSGSSAMTMVTMAEQELDKAMGMIGNGIATSTSAQTIPTVAEARASMIAAGSGAMGATVAEARASLAADVAARQLAAATSAAAVAAVAETRAVAAKSAFIGNSDNGPTLHLLVHNMYDKDEETDEGWENDIKEEFLDECSKFGKIEHAKVMHAEPGGKIYATFADVEGAKTCAENLAGRWFDKRQLRVDYMDKANPP